MKFLIVFLYFVCGTFNTGETYVNLDWENSLLRNSSSVSYTHSNYYKPNVDVVSVYQNGIYLSTGNITEPGYGNQISYSGGSYITGQSSNLSSGQITPFENTIEIVAANGQNNSCNCGVSGISSNDPNTPPCGCRYWRWNGKQWVHTGGGNNKKCDCQDDPHTTPVGDVSLLIIFFYSICYFFITRIRKQ